MALSMTDTRNDPRADLAKPPSWRGAGWQDTRGDCEVSTPSTYYQIKVELEAIRAMVFELLMSDEVASIDGPLASRLADHVLNMSEKEARDAISAYADATS